MANAMLRVIFGLQLLMLALFTTASPLDTSIGLVRRDVTQCTRDCWATSIQDTGCTNKDTQKETACMCTSLDNYKTFYHCLVTCRYLGEFSDLSDSMECVGYKHRARDVANLAERAADPQIAALTPWKTEDPKPKPAISTYHHIPFPATFGPCGVPGESCNGRIHANSAVGSSATTNAAPEETGDTDNIIQPVIDRDAAFNPPMAGSDSLQSYGGPQPKTFRTVGGAAPSKRDPAKASHAVHTSDSPATASAEPVLVTARP